MSAWQGNWRPFTQGQTAIAAPRPATAWKRAAVVLLKVARIVVPTAAVAVTLHFLFLETMAALGPMVQTGPSPATSAPLMKNDLKPMPARITVQILFVAQKEQRYETLGDWTWNGSQLDIRLSREFARKDPRYGILLLTHELVEALLCRSAGISSRQVDAFDIAFKGDGEPGDDPSAPYHQQHLWAEAAQRALAGELGVEWRRYLGG